MKRYALLLLFFSVVLCTQTVVEYNPLSFGSRFNVGRSSSSNGLPAGSIILKVSGTCPVGFSEVSALDGKTLFGTLNSHADVGGTGGNDSITPAGTNSTPVFIGSALGTHAHGVGTYATSAHSGTAVADHASHTHTYTDVVNHTHLQQYHSATTGPNTGPTTAPDTSSNTPTSWGLATQNPSGGVATGTTAGPSATLTHGVTQPSAHTVSGSSEAVSGGTPTGTNTAPVFTGTQFDNRSAFVKVIFCSKD